MTKTINRGIEAISARREHLFSDGLDCHKDTTNFYSFIGSIYRTLFDFGGKPFSLSSIVELIFFALIALLISRTISEWIKQKLLIRFKFDRDTQEAIIAVINYLSFLYNKN